MYKIGDNIVFRSPYGTYSANILEDQGEDWYKVQTNLGMVLIKEEWIIHKFEPSNMFVAL